MSIYLEGCPEMIAPEASFLSIKYSTHWPGLFVTSFVKLAHGVPEYPFTFDLLVGKGTQVCITLTVEDKRTTLVRSNTRLIRRGRPMRAFAAPVDGQSIWVSDLDD